jgi:cellulose synthase operon protein C
MNSGIRIIFAVLVTVFATGLPLREALAQETEAATRQFAAAVGIQNLKQYELAIEEWETFLKKFPKDPRVDKAQHYLGTCALQDEQYPKAIAAFQVVVTKHPKFELMDQTLLNLGISWYGVARESEKSTDFAKAETALTSMITKFPKSEFVARALYYQGESLFQQDKAAPAAAAYGRLIAGYPKHEMVPDARYALGVAQEQLKQTDKAAETYAEFARLYPKHELLTEVAMRQGEMLFTAGRFQEALPIFARVGKEKKFKLADVAMLRHARCLYEDEKYDEAGKLYWTMTRDYRQSKHFDAAVLAGGKCFYLVGKYAQARSGLELVAKRNVPEAAEATQWVARTYIKEKKPQAAVELLDKALARYSRSPQLPFLVLARIDALYDMASDKSPTISQYAKFAEDYPKHELASQALYMAALTALDTDQHDKAKQHSTTFLVRFPDDRLAPDVQFIGAEGRLLLGDYAEAGKSYGDFLKNAPQHDNAPRARVRLGLALHMAKKHPEAIRWLESNTDSLPTAELKSEAQALIGRSFSAQDDFSKAASSFEKALAANPKAKDADETILALADSYRQLNEGDKAAAQLKRLIQQHPDSKRLDEANFRLGEAAYTDGNFEAAMAYYTTVKTKWPKGEFASHSQYGLGWTYFNQNEFEKSVAEMTTLLDDFGASKIAPRGYYVRAMANYQLGEYQAVLKDVDSFVAKAPDKADSLDAQYVKGLAQAGLNEFASAATTYQTILDSADDYPAADKVAYELGWAYVELGKTTEAVAAFRKLAKDYSNSPLAGEALFRVGESWYDAEDYSKAATAYGETQRKAPGTPIAEKALHKLGWCHLKADDFGKAATAFSTQLSAHPDGELAGDAQFLQGECQFKQDQWKPALVLYAKVVATQNENYTALALYRSGECAGKLEDWPASQKFHQRVLNDYDDFEMRPEARFGVGWALQNQNKLDDAVQAYEKVTDETQTETAAKARFMIGECHFAQKNHKEATKHFLKGAFAYGHKEWSAMSFFEAARCFEVLKDVDQAKNCYQQLVEKYPAHQKVRDAKKRLAALGS